MIGAIAGDIIGSCYEGRKRNIKTTRFPLFKDYSHFTDDSVLTIAIADALLHGSPYVEKLKEYYALYPRAGYGGAFKKWAQSEYAGPYGSWGNGSAMRVSPVGFALDSLDAVLAEAEASAAVTHDHPEGIKGAQVAAAAIFLAREGKSKQEIRDYIEATFEYDLSEPLDSIRRWYARDYTEISCQGVRPAGGHRLPRVGGFRGWYPQGDLHRRGQRHHRVHHRRHRAGVLRRRPERHRRRSARAPG